MLSQDPHTMEFEEKIGRDGEVIARERPRRLSEILSELAETARGPVSVGDIVAALGDRSFAALLLFFAAMNLLPLPPGATLILGLPLMLVAAQMLWGSQRIWMPRMVNDKSFTEAQFRTIVNWLAPKLLRLEKLIQPRVWPFWRRHGERVVGLLALVLATVVTLPIPFGNWLPALSIAILALALGERDGVLFWIGVLIGVASLFVIALVVGSVTVLFAMLWDNVAWFF